MPVFKAIIVAFQAKMSFIKAHGLKLFLICSDSKIESSAMNGFLIQWYSLIAFNLWQGILPGGRQGSWGTGTLWSSVSSIRDL